jgi:hypothetical protein
VRARICRVEGGYARPDVPRSARSCRGKCCFRECAPRLPHGWDNAQVHSSSNAEQTLWVRMAHWIPVEAETPEPAPRSMLSGTGIRVRGVIERADPADDDGLVPDEKAAGDAPRTVEYVITGTVADAHDFEFDSGAGSEHGGTDIVLSVDGLLVQAQVQGWARDVVHGSRLRVRGELSVIAYHEWDDFGLVDTRDSWTVEETLALAAGDYLLRLSPRPPRRTRARLAAATSGSAGMR